MTTVFDRSATMTADDGGGDGNSSIRQTYAPSLLAAAVGNQITVTVKAGGSQTGSALALTNMFIGQAAPGATGAAPSFTGNQVRVKFAGANSLTLASGASATSDVSTLGENWDNTKSYIIAWDINTASATHEALEAAVTGATNSFATYNGGVNDASITTVSGFTAATQAQFVTALVVTAAAAGTPFTNPNIPFEDLYYDPSSTYGLGRPNGLDILQLLTAGGRPRTRLPLNAQYPDADVRLWLGTPLASDTLYLLTAGGRPRTRFPTLYNQVPEPVWPAQPTDNPALWQLARPFSNEWYGQYTVVPHPDWVGAPRQSVTLRTPSVAPFSKQWRYDYDSGAAYWQGAPVSTNIESFPSVAPFSKLWRYDYEVDKYWQGSPVPANLFLPPPAAPFSKLWRYDLITDTFWQGAPAPAPTANALLNVPVVTVFRSALYVPRPEPDKYWQGVPAPTAIVLSSIQVAAQAILRAAIFVPPPEIDRFWQGNPIRTNIATIPAAPTPFSKLWRYDLEPDKYWQGRPTPTNIRTFPSVAPFSKLWRYDLITDTHWQRYSWLAASLQMLVEGGVPFFKQWRYDLEWDKYWQGSPQPTNIRTFPSVAPFSKQWRYDLEPDKYWQGSPIPSNLQYFAFLLPLAPIYEPSPGPEQLWQGTPTGPFAKNLLPAAPPFSNEWFAQYQYDSDTKPWVWPGTDANTLQGLVAGGKPFSKQWRYDLEFDKYWQGSPIPTNPLFFPFVAPFSNEWFAQYQYDSDTKLWQRYSLPAVTQNMLVEGGRPFSNEWFVQYTWNTEFPQWQGSPLAAKAPYIAPIKPPFVGWYNQYQYDSDTKLWSWTGTDANTLQSLVAGGPPFSKLWVPYLDTDVRLWQRYSLPAITQNMLVEGGPPFFKQWRYDLEWDKYWQGAPVSTNLRFFPFVSPFSNVWFSQTAYNQEFYWYGAPISTEITSLPKAPPFHQQWRYDYDSGATYWAGAPSPSTTLVILSQPKMFGAGGQSPTKQWHYDADFNTYWQGAPSALSPVFITQFFGSPFQAVQSQWHFNMDQEFYWHAVVQPQTNLALTKPVPVRPPTYAVGTFHRDDIIWWPTKQPNVALLTSLLPQMVPSTFKWEHPPIETIWVGHPWIYPTEYMRVIAAVVNPKDLIPRRPLTERRKDAIPDDPLFPRRKDPI